MSTPVADLLPSFALLGTDGAVHTPADYADAPVLVVIQACNHCPFVQAWEPRIEAIARDYADAGVRVVVVNSNDAEKQPEDSYALMRERAAERGIAHDYLYDEDQALARALGAERTPEAFVFDAGRRLAYHGAVDDSRDDEAVTASHVRDAIDALLQGRPVPVPSTPVVGCTIKWKA
jgi:thiol-disulfide isomerase/thioredoxin